MRDCLGLQQCGEQAAAKRPRRRQMVELMYEFEELLVLDGSKLTGAFPSFEYTSRNDAVHHTVEWFRQRSASWFEGGKQTQIAAFGRAILHSLR